MYVILRMTTVTGDKELVVKLNDGVVNIDSNDILLARYFWPWTES